MFDHIGGWRGLLGCVLGCVVVAAVAQLFVVSEALGWVVLVATVVAVWPRTGWGRR